MKKLLFALGISMALVVSSFGQSWVPLANGVQTGLPSYNTTGFRSVTYNGNLYVAYTEYITNQRNLVVKVWDGQSWSQLPTTNFGNWGSVYSIIGYQGSIYVSGGPHFLHQFNGTSWSQPLSGVGFTGGVIEDMEVHNNTLVGVGHLGTSAGYYMGMEYDGQSWSPLPLYSTGTTTHAYPLDCKSSNGDLYVVLMQDSLNPKTFNVLKLDNSGWSDAASNLYNSSLTNVEVQHLGVLNNNLYAMGRNGFYAVRNDSVILQSSFTSSAYYYASSDANFNGHLYFSGYQQNLGGEILRTDGSSFTALANVPTGVSGINLCSDGNMLYGTGNFTASGGFDHVMATAGGAATIGGKLYLDANNNCTYDTGETPIAGAMVTLNPGNLKVATNSWGDYSIGVNAGSYTVDNVTFTRSIHSGVSITNCVSLPLSLSASNGNTTQTDIATQVGLQTDAAVVFKAFIGFRARHGFTENYQLKVQNRGATAISGITATLQLPTGLSINSATPVYTSGSGSVYSWSISSLNSLEEFVSTVAITIDTNVVSIGDTLTFVADIGTVAGDVDVSNNISEVKQPVSAAVDPNDKAVSITEAAPGLNSLDYHIRFQNTGNDTAYNIVIRDELEAYFDLEDITINAASHDYVMTIENGNIMTWTFNNILLPDSGASYAGSQGFVNFTIGVDPTLNVGDIIDNDAQIYFDYQPPVHTNHAKTVIVNNIGLDEGYEVSMALEVYPNPASDRLYLKNTSRKVLKIRMFSAAGKEVLSLGLDPYGVHSLDLDNLPSGVYILNSDAGSYRVIVKD